MGSIERRVRKLEGPRGKRGPMSFEHLTDEELNARIREFEDRMLADPDTEDRLREAIIYEREHGRSGGRVVAIMREDLARS